MKGAKLVHQGGYLSSATVDQQESKILSVLGISREEGLAPGILGYDLHDSRADW